MCVTIVVGLYLWARKKMNDSPECGVSKCNLPVLSCLSSLPLRFLILNLSILSFMYLGEKNLVPCNQ